jgi:hypothetical protein
LDETLDWSFFPSYPLLFPPLYVLPNYIPSITRVDVSDFLFFFIR